MKQNPRLRKTVIAYAFLLPALVLLGVFTLYPIFYGVALAFHNYNIIKLTDTGTPVPPVWVGMSNFTRLWGDPYFHTALRNSILYLLVVPFIQLVSMLLALLVNRPWRGMVWFRAAFYVPVITSIVVVGIAWKWILRSDGAVNFMIHQILPNLAPIPWLTDGRMALFSVMFVTFWQGLGYYMVLYLAGLQTIPPEMDEAARIDGASPWHRFWWITMPLLKPTLALCTIISCISALKVFGEIYVMTMGGPEHATLTVAYYVFNQAFMDFDMGYAAAIALVLAGFVMAVSYINTRIFKEGGLTYYY